ncbi:MAG TPA: hypothetical protein VFQ85_07300 [Mycobacteriales bacterium]|jgi:hypothetical protein|nr:hypothetical protein [Mycobacteriales bacterium]
MPRLVAVAAAACALLPAAPARAVPAPVAGRACGMATRNDITGLLYQDPTDNFGEVHAGPVIVRDPGEITGDGVPGTIICDIQVGGTGVYPDPNASRSVADGNGTIVLPATPVEFDSPVLESVFLCSTLVLTGSTGSATVYHWDALTQTWAMSGREAHCELSVVTGPGTARYVP